MPTKAVAVSPIGSVEIATVGRPLFFTSMVADMLERDDDNSVDVGVGLLAGRWCFGQYFQTDTNGCAFLTPCKRASRCERSGRDITHRAALACQERGGWVTLSTN